MSIETKVRGAQAAPAQVPTDEKFIEVETKRKYTPLYCYEVESYEAGVHPDSGAPILRHMASVTKNEDGKPIKQLDQIVDYALDKFNERKPVFKEILDSVPAGTTIELPAQEASRLIKAGVAQPTNNTFR